MIALAPLFTVQFLFNDVFLITYEACGTRKVSLNNRVRQW